MIFELLMLLMMIGWCTVLALGMFLAIKGIGTPRVGKVTLFILGLVVVIGVVRTVGFPAPYRDPVAMPTWYNIWLWSSYLVVLPIIVLGTARVGWLSIKQEKFPARLRWIYGLAIVMSIIQTVVGKIIYEMVAATH